MARKKKEDSLSTEKKEVVKKPKAIGPFDIINMMFRNDGEFEKLTDFVLSRNFFMINRVFAIQYPLQAQFFNKLTINQADVVKSWRTFAVSQFGYRTPGFVYTKGGKKTTADVVVEVSKEIKEQYCKHYRISYKDFDDMLLFNHDNTLEHVKMFEENTK